MRDDARRIIDTKRTENPLKSFMWYVELPHDIVGFEGNVFDLNSRISSISTPYNTLETGRETQGNSFWYFAKSIDIGSITLEIVEHEDGLSYDYFEKWQQMIANSNGTFNPPKYYKRDLTFFRLDTTKTKVISDTYQGYFVSGISDVANDYETNGLVKYTVTLTGDSVQHKHMNRQSAQVANRDDFFNKIHESRRSKKSLLDLLLPL